MKRFFIILFILAISFMLMACSNSYDDEIENVISLENEELEDPSVKTDIDTLKRDNTSIWVYEDANYIELEYVIRGQSETANPVYKYDNESDTYVNSIDGEFSSEEIEDQEADYTENVDE